MKMDQQTVTVRVGSRKSELALIQTKYVISKLEALNPYKKFEIVTMSTLGDLRLDVPLPKIGEKSLFTKELETALSVGSVDFVVHSLKDLPTVLPLGMAIGAVLEREDPRDALVLRQDYKDYTLDTLPKDSVIGTSSLRRSAQLAKKYPHLKVQNIRGNLNTRLKKLDELGCFHGLILAAAGLYRMGWKHRISQIIEDDDILYAVGQGALAVECRQNDIKILELLSSLYDMSTAIRIVAERSLLKTLGGGCSAPVAVTSKLTPLKKDVFEISLTAAVWSLDGSNEILECHQAEILFDNLKMTKRCSTCPFNDVGKNSSSSEKDKSTTMPDIEVLVQCTKRKNCVGEDSCSRIIKKQKLIDINSDNHQEGNNSLLSQEDPHESCPVKLPVGVDFMGQCPYLEAASSSSTSNFVVNQIEHPNKHNLKSGDISKCPFFKESVNEQNEILASGDQCSLQLYTGLVKHSHLSESALNGAETLGQSLAKKLMKGGAVEVMEKAQAVIRGTS